MVLKMEQGGILQHQLPIQNDYSLPLDQDCADQCGAGHQQDAFSTAAMDALRRDNALTQHLSPSYPYQTSQAPNQARFVSDRGTAGCYQATGNFTDSSSGSISTSPSSAASSLAYTNYGGTQQYTSVQQYPSSVQLGHSFVPPSAFPTVRSTALLDTSTHSMLPHPHQNRSQSSVLPNVTERDTFNATTAPYLARSQIQSTGYAGITNYPGTPRSVAAGTAALTLSPGDTPYSNMALSNNYTPQASDCANFPWSDNEVVSVLASEGRELTPKILAKVEKGFFADTVHKRWTCYRRNYFSVTCGFELRPNVAGARITVQHNGSTEQVQAMGMRLSAAVDGGDGKNIELVQHTPKRDNGPKNKIEVVKVAPTISTNRMDQSVYQMQIPFPGSSLATGPSLPLQQYIEDGDTQAGASQSSQSSAYGYQNSAPANNMNNPPTTYTFERVQFKQATANNGKRRATQQFFHLIVELFADIRKENARKPVWVKVAQRVSEKIVVRGRSPSHYQNDKSESAVVGRGMSSGGYGGSISGTGYAGLNAGGFRLNNAYGSVASNALRRGDLGYSDGGSQSDSSNSSGEEGPTDQAFSNDTVMSDADRLALHEHDGYQYFPGTMYENVQQTGVLPPLSKPEDCRTERFAVKAEYADAVPGAQYHANSCGRFQGVETSRGYFPDLHTRF